MSDSFLTLRQLAEELRAPGESLGTVVRRLRLYKDAGRIPYHQIVKGGVLRFRLSEVCAALQSRVAQPLSQAYNPSQSQRLYLFTQRSNMSEVTVYQRGKNWSFSIHDREFVRVYGERVRLTCKAKGKREAIKLGEAERSRLIAEAQAKKLRVQVAPNAKLIGGKPAPLPIDTFSTFIDNWYRSWSELNKRPSTFKSDTWRLRVLEEYFGEYPLNQIVRPMVETFKAVQAKKLNQYGRLPTGASVNRLLELGSAIFTKVSEWTDYEYNPFRRVKHFREQSRKRVLTLPEEMRLDEHLKRPKRKMLRLCILLAQHAGLRKGEILGLRRRDVVFEKEWLLIQDAKTGDRIVPLNSILRSALERVMPVTLAADELVLGGVDWVKDNWPLVCQEAGIEGLHFHDLRATYVTRILEAGFDSFTARDAAGHAQVRTTGIYARPSLERVRKAVDSLTETAQICSAGSTPSAEK